MQQEMKMAKKNIPAPLKTKSRIGKTITSLKAKSATRRRQEPKAEITKSGQIEKLLRRPHGATLAELALATSWQPHSIRGLMSGTIVKRKGLKIISEKSASERRYRIFGTAV
jgi:hypothetical protein